ncbi:MAG: hypothetical protein Q4D37_08985 [Oscillospiraceae bacterium]|nr:hypothetical protein [Oscillospiraceae bacterium]
MTRKIKGVLAAVLATASLTVGTVSLTAVTPVAAIEGITATLTGSLDNSNYVYYGVGKTNKNIESTTATVDSDGDYVITWTVSGSASSVDYMYLDFSFPTPINTQPIKDTFPNLNINVTEVKVGSTVVPYTMGSNAVNYDYLNGGLDSVRVTLCDPTTSGTGYLDKTTAVAQTLSISFSVTGLNDDAATTTTAATTTAVSETATIATTMPVTQQAPSTVTTTAVATPTQTADLSVGAIAVGAVAAVSLAGAAFTITRRKKK